MRVFVFCLLVSLVVLPVAANTYTVINTADSGAGSLRQAILDANGNGGLDTIDFNIAAAGVQTITPVTQLPTITSPVTIDGYTQPGASANTLASGSDAVILIELSGANGIDTGLTLNGVANGSTIRGIAVNRFQMGITFDGTDNSFITGCFIGTDAGGSIDRGNHNSGLFILSGAQNNQFGGTTPAERNVISGNQTGINMGNDTTMNNTILGNYIGPNAAGTGIVGSQIGIGINSSGPNTIGSAAAPNVISGNSESTSAGISISNSTTGVIVRNNLIGVRPDGTTPMPNGTGITFFDGFSGAPTNITIGGAGAANVIANSTLDGIAMKTFLNFFMTGVKIQQNSIYGSGEMGIDLGDNGVTPNDALDGDGGFNRYQNFPVITSANALNGFLTINGTLSSQQSKSYDVEFFHNTACDATGYGEGQTYLGTTTITTNAAGNASFNFTIASGLTTGVITALATDNATSDTSEFSLCAPVMVPASTTFSISDASVIETNAGTTNMTFTITLSAAPGAAVGVSFQTADDTAMTSNNDYVNSGGSVSFSGSETSKTFNVTVNGDATPEADEKFFVNLSTPTGNSALGDSQGIGTIINDDAVPSITIADVPKVEGNAGSSNMTFTVTVNPAPAFDVSVKYATSDGTAIAGSDYTSSTGMVTIAATQTTAMFAVPITGETLTESNETFTVTLFDATNGTLTDAQATGTITNDDNEPSISISDPSVTEGNSGTKNLTFTLTLTNPSSQVISVPFSLADNTANVGVDYLTNSGSFTVIAGATTSNLSISIKGDTDIEPDETFFVNITDPPNASLSETQGTGTILNDDVAITPTITVNDVSVNEAAGTLQFTITLSPTPVAPGSVTYSTADNTATAGSDYTAITSTLTPFAAAQTQILVNVPITNDSYLEADETFYLNLTAATGGSIGDNQGVGTITNNDIGPDLTVTKTAPANVTIGVPFDYVISVTNSGGDATGLVITDDLPGNVNFVSSTPDAPGNCSGTSTVTCTYATLNGGSTVNVTIRVTPTTTGAISNTASALADQLDSNGANNSDGAASQAASAFEPIPTASEWGLLVLLMGLAVLAMKRM